MPKLESTGRFSDYHSRDKIEEVNFEIQRTTLVDVIKLLPEEPTPDLSEICLRSANYIPQSYRFGSTIKPDRYTHKIIAPGTAYVDMRLDDLPGYMDKKYPAFKVKLGKGQFSTFKKESLPLFDRKNSNETSYKLMEAKLIYEYVSQTQQSYLQLSTSGEDVVVRAVVNRKCGLRSKVTGLDEMLDSIRDK